MMVVISKTALNLALEGFVLVLLNLCPTTYIFCEKTLDLTGAAFIFSVCNM